jgi:hypothetical protein
MARVAPGVVRHGTAKNLADVGQGYSANGESEFSRQSAHSANAVKMRGNSPKTTGKRTTAEIIAQNETQLAKLRGNLLIENNPARIAKMKRDLEIKSAFVARLKAETTK